MFNPLLLSPLLLPSPLHHYFLLQLSPIAFIGTSITFAAVETAVLARLATAQPDNKAKRNKVKNIFINYL